MDVKRIRPPHVGLLLVGVGLLANKGVVEYALVADGHIGSARSTGILVAVQVLLIVVGVRCLFASSLEDLLNDRKRLARRLPGLLRVGSVVLPLMMVVAVAAGSVWYYNARLLWVYETPGTFSRRQADMTVNVHGWRSPFAGEVRYSLNGGPRRPVASGGQRLGSGEFVVEMFHEDLRAGVNCLVVDASPLGRGTISETVEFSYDPGEVELPIHLDWADAEPQPEDGQWETILLDGGRRVRPKPGHEGYDRLLVAAGAFDGPRRVETDVIFRYSTNDNHGFGVLPLWGGRPDEAGYSPRRGWNFALVWYWSRFRGAGAEFSYRFGGNPPSWVNSYRNVDIVPGAKYHILAECWPEKDADGNHLCYHERIKWWRDGEPKPAQWIKVSDTGGSPLPPREYGVALVVFNCQVDFGPISVTRCETPSAALQSPVSQR